MYRCIIYIEPQMWQLNDMVIPRIMGYWKDVAYSSLHYDVYEVKAIEEKCKNDPKKCCQELFEKWLCVHKPGDAKTWESLLTQLKKVEELTSATEEILKELTSNKQD